MMWKAVAKTDEFVEGKHKGFVVDDKPIMISKLEGRFYAIDAICLHKFAYLPIGARNGDCIICPAHFAEFDLKSGRMVKDMVSNKVPNGVRVVPDLKVYELKIEGNEIKIMI